MSTDVVTALRELQVLKDRLYNANLDLKKWKITFECKVEPEFERPGSFSVKITARVGDSVVNRLLTAEDVMYFSNDEHSITRMLAETLMDALLLEQVTSSLGEQLVPAINNAKQLNERKSSL